MIHNTLYVISFDTTVAELLIMNNENANYLGIDWGATNIGVALAHQETGVALPYVTLKNDADVLARLGKIIASENIATVVIGILEYLHQDGGLSAAEKFGQSLTERFGVKVAYENEMFTTKMAQSNLIERGIKGASKNNDEEAARIILQEWLGKKSIGGQN